VIGSVADQLAVLAGRILDHAGHSAPPAGMLSQRNAHDGRFSHAEVHPADLPWIEHGVHPDEHGAIWLSSHGHSELLTVEQARARIAVARRSGDKEAYAIAGELAVAVAQIVHAEEYGTLIRGAR
jgi:hypothetical protein